MAEPSCCTTVKDGRINLVSCKETGWEGLWSGEEPGTYHAMAEEHWLAHGNREVAMLRQNARRIYRTTEPGDPARRGIAPYL